MVLLATTKRQLFNINGSITEPDKVLGLLALLAAQSTQYLPHTIWGYHNVTEIDYSQSSAGHTLANVMVC